MSGEYSVPCQRCTKRNAAQKKITGERACLVFAAATGRPLGDVRLCGSCLRTVDSLTLSIAKAKTRRIASWRK